MTGLESLMPAMGGNQHQNQHQNYDPENPSQVAVGGRRRRRSRTRKGKRGRKGRGGYLMDVVGAAALLGATQLAKGRAGYGYTGKNGYYGSRKSRRSRRSSRSRSRR